MLRDRQLITTENRRSRYRLLLRALTVLVSGALYLATLPLASAARFENPLRDLDHYSHTLSGINAVVQDRHGFIWIASENGLGRFDGQSLKFYESVADEPLSLPSSYVWNMVLDHNDVMWVATRGGISRYDSTTDSFHHIARGSIPSVTTLVVAPDNSLYLGSSRGLFWISPDREQVRMFFPDPPIERSLSHQEIRALKFMPDGKLWLGTAGMGAAIFDPATEAFTYLLHEVDNPNSLAYNDVKSIALDDDGDIWLGTYGRGISVYSPATGRFRHYPYDPRDPGALNSGEVTFIHKDRTGQMWIALDHGGLARFDKTTGTFERFLHEPSDPTTVASNQLRTIYEDRNGDLWIGGFPSGVSLYNRTKQVFRTYQAKQTDPHGLSNNSITTIYEDRNRDIWVGTEGGLHHFDPTTGVFTVYRADPENPHALMADAILAIREDSVGDLWVGTWAGGLHRFDRAQDIFYRYYPDEQDPASISSKFVWDIAEDQHKNLWIATQTGGLNLYLRDTDSFTSYRNKQGEEKSLADNFIWDLLVTRNNDLWIGTLHGLNRMDAAAQQFDYFPSGNKDGKSVSGAHIRSLFEDRRGRIWIGTQEQGVSIYDPESQTFAYLDVQQGLPSTTVTGIVEDNAGDMWLTTTNGLVQHHHQSHQLSVYGKEHGLAGSHFNRNAALKASDGTLYFGGTEGLTVFNPDDLMAQEPDFPVHLTRFQILNKDAAIGPDAPLKTSIVEAQEVHLSHRDIMFSFDFAALNYRSTAANEYAYMLEGFDRNWNYIATRSTATYTNIGSGTYFFRVKARSRNGAWVEKEPALKIVVAPPPWLTWWAYFGYALVVGLVIYLRREHRVLRRSAETYKIQSVTDSLTRLYNRAGIVQVSNRLFTGSETCKDAAVMVIDIDHFKRINDRYGHDVGDLVLTQIAELLMNNVRRGDYLGRWGGEEFILLCPSATPAAARGIAEKLRAVVEQHSFHGGGNEGIRVTVSIGLAMTQQDETFARVLKRADMALYEGKDTGRNRVCIASVPDLAGR